MSSGPLLLWRSQTKACNRPNLSTCDESSLKCTAAGIFIASSELTVAPTSLKKGCSKLHLCDELALKFTISSLHYI